MRHDWTKRSALLVGLDFATTLYLLWTPEKDNKQHDQLMPTNEFFGRLILP